LRRKTKLVKLLQEFEMRTIGAVLLASSLIASSAFAATDASAPLAPGKPAGVKHAQEMDNTLLLVLGLGVVAGGIALVASGNGHSTVTTTTASTSTTGANAP
jgi:hypothetical protein